MTSSIWRVKNHIRMVGTEKKLTVFLVFILLVNTSLTLSGSIVSGVSWDEPVHVNRLIGFFSSSLYGRGPETLSLESEQLDMFSYGPIPALGAHLLNVLLGFESWGEPTKAAISYVGRHIFVFLISLLGVAATGILGFLLSGKKIYGLLAAVILTSIPNWTGHSMFNVKDVPVAVGYTLITLSIVAFYKDAKWRIVGFFSLALGLFLSVGTRPAFISILIVTGLIAISLHFLLSIIKNKKPKLKGSFSLLITVFSASALGYAALQIIYPSLFASPFTTSVLSFQSASSYGWSGNSLSAGIVHDQPPPDWYIPVWLISQTPVLVMVLALMATYSVIRSLLIRKYNLGDETELGMFGRLMVLAQVTMVPAGAIILSSTVYDGLRQMMFMLPGIAVLAAVGILQLQNSLDGKFPRKRGWQLTSLIAVVTVLIPSIEQARLHPYQYTYYSEIGRVQGVDNIWPTDYWKVSLRELVSYVPEGGEIYCGGVPCSDPSATPYLDRSEEGSEGDEGLHYSLKHNRFGVSVSEGCSTYKTIERPLFPHTMTIGWVEKCETQPD